MRTSIIDIGTNTILMLIGEYDVPSSQISTLLDIQRIPRLGKGVDSNRNILPESIEKAVEILIEYKVICRQYEVNRMVATATSFIRDANNKYEFIKQIRDNTGIGIEILSGESEARWTFCGGVYDLLEEENINPVAAIDIGGGSTEITVSPFLPDNITRNSLLNLPIESKSINAGSVRIKERFLQKHPPSKDGLKQAEKFIFDNFERVNFNFTNAKLVGVAGTITTLAAIKKKLNKYEREKVDGIEIALEEVEKTISKLSKKRLEQLYKIGDYMEGRADIIIPGILILKCFMKKFGFEKLMVSTKGLRYGIFLRESAV